MAALGTTTSPQPHINRLYPTWEEIVRPYQLVLMLEGIVYRLD